MARFRDAMAPGGYLAISHATADFHPELGAAATPAYDRASAPLVTRSRATIEGFFDGFDLVEPGLVPVAAWRPDPVPNGKTPDHPGPAMVWGYGGVGRKR